MAERLVVTGLGAVTALGLTADENWTAARDGLGGITIEPFDPGPHGPESVDFPAALVKTDANVALEQALGRRIGASLDLFSTYALKAAHEALAQAGLLGAPLGP